MTITVTEADLGTVRNGGSVIMMTGTDDEGGRVTFAGDARPMANFIEAVIEDGEAYAEVESWQIMGRQ